MSPIWEHPERASGLPSMAFHSQSRSTAWKLTTPRHLKSLFTREQVTSGTISSSPTRFPATPQSKPSKATSPPPSCAAITSSPSVNPSWRRAQGTAYGYLLWLACKAPKSALTVRQSMLAVRLNGGRIAFYMRGLANQMTNAKAALVWISIFSLAMDGEARCV